MNVGKNNNSKQKTQSINCDVCKKSFKFNSHLNVHKRIHLGAKPHQCNVCDKGFGRIDVLKRHMMLHSGKKV